MIVKTFNRLIITSRIPPLWQYSERSISLRNLKESINEYFSYPQRKPPYNHVCQVGDPVLRARADAIDPNTIRIVEFQKILDHLEKTMKYYGACGLSAPQIGLPWQIFVMQVTEKHLKKFDPSILRSREMEVFPLRFFINPSLKVKDFSLVELAEGCESIRGYNAIVPRAKAVEVTAVDRNGESFTLLAKGWTARIIQHEFDHLQGIVYTDKMDATTLSCTCWQEVNKFSGKIAIRFRPK